MKCPRCQHENPALLRGDWEETSSLAERFAAMCRAGGGGNLIYALLASAQALAQRGYVAEAARQVSEGQRLLEDLSAQGLLLPLRIGYYLLGRSCFLLDRLDEARTFAERALALTPNVFLPYALHLLGDIASHPERWDVEGSTEHYRQALSIAEARGMRPLIAHCHLGFGRLSHRSDKREQAREHLATARTMYRDMGMTYWVEQAEAEIGLAQ